MANRIYSELASGYPNYTALAADNSTYAILALQPAKTGSINGSSAATGAVVGVEGDLGLISGLTVSTGTVAGVFGYKGSLTGTSSSTGSVIGAEGDIGLINGTTISTGTAVGYATVPTGISPPRKVRPPVTDIVNQTPFVPLRTGSVLAATFSDGSVDGRLGYRGRKSIGGTSISASAIAGVIAPRGSVKQTSQMQTKIRATIVIGDPLYEIKQVRRQLEEELLATYGAL